MSHIAVHTDGPICTIKIAREEKKNALTLDMYRALREALISAKQTASIRVVVVCGGTNVFSAGNDLADFAKVGATGNADALAPTLEFLQELATLDKPMIAAVSGPAIGIGTTLLLHCDFVFAADNASFKLPFVDLALVPEAASSLLLERTIGRRNAARMLLGCESINAATALQWGLITAIAGDPVVAAQEQALVLSKKAPSALVQSKQLMKSNLQAQVLSTIQSEGEVFVSRLKSPEAMEAFSAFMMRRPPDFSKF